MTAPLLLVLAAALAAAVPAAAATFKVTLLMPADDPRLERQRLERALLGHAGGPAVYA
jgi:CTP:molybdopterin cytidylyltransferase MocA